MCHQLTQVDNLTVKFDIQNSKKQKIISNFAKYFQQSTNISKKNLIFATFLRNQAWKKRLRILTELRSY